MKAVTGIIYSTSGNAAIEVADDAVADHRRTGKKKI
jgi:hypothetical protein